VSDEAPAEPMSHDQREEDPAPERPTDVPSPTGRAIADDRTQFTDLVRRHDDRMRALSYLLLAGDRDRMDDALQDAYLRAYVARDRFRGDADPGTWLYRIVYNACIDELRRQRRRATPVDAAEAVWEAPSTAPGPEVQASDKDATLRALALLPHDQRVAVVLVDGQGFDHRAAAQALGIAPGTVASRLSRARAHLRRAIGEEER
jgi:RNA polymerase sigma-70 factor (ECF subfamily)